MAWTATLKTVFKRATGQAQCVVRRGDGSMKSERVFVLTGKADASWLKHQILDAITEIDAAFTYADSLKEGTVDLTPDAPKPIPIPAPAPVPLPPMVPIN